MPDVVKPGPPDGREDEDGQENHGEVMDVMGNSGRDFPLQVSFGALYRPCVTDTTDSSLGPSRALRMMVQQ